MHHMLLLTIILTVLDTGILKDSLMETDKMSKLKCGHAKLLKHIINMHWNDLGKVKKN